jgi:membrane fusion protein, multidrug efflux system
VDSLITRARHRYIPVVSLLLMVSFFGCSKEGPSAAPPLPVKTTEVVQRDVPIYKEWVGQTTGAVDIELRARVAGWLQGMHFSEGTEVKKGTLLYTIDQSELKQAVAEAKGRLAQARTLMMRAKSDVNRYRPLAQAGAVSQRDLESAEAEYGARQGEVDAAQASLNVAEINLGYASLTAPIDGLVGISLARVGDFVGRPPNPVILNTISRIDTIHVRFSITEAEYLDLANKFAKKGTPSAQDRTGKFQMILADGSVYSERGTVLFLQRQVDASTGTLQLEAAFPNPRRLIRPGQFARARAIYEEVKGAMVVPAKAVFEIQGQFALYVIGEGNKTEFRRVKAGPMVGQLRVIEDGVKAGEKVVVEGVQRLRPDIVVAPSAIPLDSILTAGQPGGGR